MSKAFQIVHEMPGRMRIRYGRYAFSLPTALGLEETIQKWNFVHNVKANETTGSLLLYYDVDCRDDLLAKLKEVDIDHVAPCSTGLLEYANKQAEVKQQYIKQFEKMVAKRYLTRWFLPTPIRSVYTFACSLKYIKKGLSSLYNSKLDVPVLDATSISVSMINRDFTTASNIMFLLSISELLEDYTKKKTTLQLKESLSINIDKVWILNEDGVEQQISTASLEKGDTVVVQVGTMVPVDGEVVSGTAMINESSFTGEPLSKAVSVGSTVFAGTVVEEGKIFVKVRNLQKESRINKIVDMISENESLKASVQANAEHLADALVPYSFIGFFGLLAITRNLTRASSILLVDYSCAVKLSTSITVISAMQEAANHAIMIKGGKYLEAMAQADTIVFDKTGTLTNAKPRVQDVIPMEGFQRDEVLRISACLEEHFPHSVANAIVKQAEIENLKHAEEHAKVEYIIAHGIATTLNGQRAIIGSEHFIFEDEGIEKTQEVIDKMEMLQKEGASSMIFLALGDKLAGIISIFDPLKEEAKDVVNNLRLNGFEHIVMLTGDSENAARHIAEELGIDEYRAQVLPEDKANYIKEMHELGRKVVMVGDGVNDTPALSVSDVSISMQDSSDIARELADITLLSSNLNEIVEFKKLSSLAIDRIHTNYSRIISFNSLLILGGIFGVLQPSMSALLHNSYTFAIAAQSTTHLLEEKH